MVAAAFTLAQLLHICAPDVGARTMTAIVRVESGGNPLAIHDNTLRRSFSPQDARQAVVWTNQLLAMHHSVDLGLSQINNANLPRLGLSVTDAFDACSNLSAGSLILALDYRAASRQFGPGQYALRSAIGAYNTGSLFAGYAYVDRILAAAGLGASQAMQMPDLQAAPAADRTATANRVRTGDVPAVSASVDSPVPITLSAPVRVRATKRRPIVRASADSGSILVTTAFPNARRTATAGALTYDHSDLSPIMLHVTPSPVWTPSSH